MACQIGCSWTTVHRGAPASSRSTSIHRSACGCCGWAFRVSHGRPHHPQTQGKDERFHRTLKAEVLQRPPFDSLAHAQQAFDGWRDVYNLERPHEACGLAPPVSRYRPSARTYPERLASIEYGPDDQVRRVQHKGATHFRGHLVPVGLPFIGELVAVRPTATDGVLEVYFMSQRLRQIDLRSAPAERRSRPRPAAPRETAGVNHVPAHP